MHPTLLPLLLPVIAAIFLIPGGRPVLYDILFKNAFKTPCYFDWMSTPLHTACVCMSVSFTRRMACI